MMAVVELLGSLIKDADPELKRLLGRAIGG
jgi:hypothetical protein